MTDLPVRQNHVQEAKGMPGAATRPRQRRAEYAFAIPPYALPDEEFPAKRRVSGIRGFHWRFTLSRMITDKFRTSSWLRRRRCLARRAKILPQAAQAFWLALFNDARRKEAWPRNRPHWPAAGRGKRLLGSRCRVSRQRKPHGSPWRA